MKAWKLLYIVGATMTVVALYLLHEAIWPGRGIFVESFAPLSHRANNPRPAGDFSGVGTFAYFVQYYLPAGAGIVMCIAGRWLQVTERVPRHVLYDEMTDGDED